MGGSLVPALDPAPLPGPAWLFHILWVVTFLIHIVFVNVVLGGTLLAALSGPRRGGARTARLFVGINAWAISFAITFGIAPLLFVQVMLGRFFYSATVLVGWAWFGILFLLIVGYYLNYIVKARMRSGRGVRGLLAVEAVCFLAIAGIQVAVNLLHAQPGRWERVADQAWTAVADPSWIPRYLHFVLAAVGMSGVLLARVAVARAGAGREEEAAMARYGIRAALIATATQMAGGSWLLFSIPRDVLIAFMRGGIATTLPLLLGVIAGAGLLFFLVQIRDPLAEARKVKRVVELMLASILFMVVTRHQLRGIYLAPARADEAVAVAPQWGMALVFAVTLAGAVGLTVYALVRALKDRPGAGEDAA